MAQHVNGHKTNYVGDAMRRGMAPLKKAQPKELGLNVHIILAVVVGMFLHISTTIIFETSENHRVNLLKLICILFGAGLAMLLS